MSTTRAWLLVVPGLGACLAASACSLESGSKDPVSQASPRLARAAPAQSAPLEYVLEPASRAELAIAERQGKRLRGEVPVASGRLWLDPADLAGTRATVTFDLGALQLWDAGSKPPPDGAPRSHSTEQSLDWLQLSRPEDIRAHPELRYARFTLLGIGSSSSNDLDAATTVRSGKPAVVARRVRLRASGELELHGHRLPQTVALDATFEWIAPAEPSAPPSRVLLETTEPFSVDLLGHGIVPRNARGEVLAESVAELRRSRRDPVQVRVRWVATPAATIAGRSDGER